MENIQENIQEAMRLFSESEKESYPSKRKFEKFKKAIDLLEEDIKDNPNSKYKEQINNIKISNTRSLLRKLRDFSNNRNFINRNTNDLVSLVVILFKLLPEIKLIKKNNPDLYEDYKTFMNHFFNR